MGMAGYAQKRRGGEEAAAFTHLDAATADATKHGFDPFTQYWIARIDGRTIHYRAGEAPVNLPSDETPRG
jgi:hypothetical protein